MHVVQCLTNSDYGGGQAFAYQLVSGLRKYFPELEQTIILPRGIYFDRFTSLGVQVKEADLNRLSLTSLIQTQKIIDRLNPDIVHSYGKGAGLYARELLNKKQKRIHIHSYLGFHPPAMYTARRMYLGLERVLLKHTDCLIAVSHSEEAELRNIFQPAHGKITSIRTIVDPDYVRQKSRDPLPNAVRSFLDQWNEGCIVVMIGRNDPVKNYPLAFQSMNIALEKFPKLAFVTVGWIGRNEAELHLQTKYPDRVLHIGALPETAPLLNGCTVLLLTSKKEGSPLTVLEAFALGKPVIGTHVDGIRDLVQDGINGLVCEQNPEALADAIGRLAPKSKEFLRLCAGAAQSGNRMDFESWVNEYYQTYQSVTRRAGETKKAS
jgi:glycosyltransferase involved in cell wall biosynthesis